LKICSLHFFKIASLSQLEKSKKIIKDIESEYNVDTLRSSSCEYAKMIRKKCRDRDRCDLANPNLKQAYLTYTCYENAKRAI